MTSPAKNELGEMPLMEHLNDLRKSIFWSVISLAIGFFVAYFFSKNMFRILLQPLFKAWTDAGLGSPELHYASPIEPFFTYFKLALTSGIFIASPGVFYQIWRFIGPGLYKNERRVAIPLAVLSALFFVGGACFGYFIVFPYGFKFFLTQAQYNAADMQNVLMSAAKVDMTKVAPVNFSITPKLMMGECFSIIWRLLFAFGLVFELPIVIACLAIFGIVTPKFLWKANPYFIVIAFIISAVLTPPDVITQLFMAGPLIVLYNASIGIAWFFQRKKRKKASS